MEPAGSRLEGGSQPIFQPVRDQHADLLRAKTKTIYKNWFKPPMDLEKKIKILERNRSTINLITGNLVFALAQWSFMLLLARINGAGVAGVYSLALGVSAPIFLFLSFQLRVIYATDFNHKFNFKTYLNARILGLSLAVIFSLLIGFLFLKLNITSENFMLMMVLVSIIKLLDGLSDICYGTFQREGLFGSYAISLFLRGLVSSLSFLCILLYTKDVIVAFSGVILVYFFVYRFFDFPKAIKVGRSNTKGLVNDKSDTLRLIRYGFGMGVAAVLDSLLVNFQRYLISNELGIHDLGLYVPVVQLIIMMQIFISSMGQYFLPKLSIAYNNRSSEYMKIGLRFLLSSISLGLIGLIVAVMAGDNILILLYGPEYENLGDILILACVGAILWYSSGALSCMLSAAQAYGSHVVINFSTLLASTIMTLILIPHYKLYGAAVALTIGFFVRLTLSSLFLSSAIKRKWKDVNSNHYC